MGIGAAITSSSIWTPQARAGGQQSGQRGENPKARNYARGVDMMNIDYQYLDLVHKGGNEIGKGPFWVRRREKSPVTIFDQARPQLS
jgi:hypothetical protein